MNNLELKREFALIFNAKIKHHIRYHFAAEIATVDESTTEVELKGFKLLKNLTLPFAIKLRTKRH